MATPVIYSRSFRGSYTTDDAPHERLLGRVEFGLGLQRPDDPRRVVVALDPLSEPCWAEQWLSDRPVAFGREDDFGYSHNGEVLFGNIYLAESELVDLERATLRLYVRIEQLLQRMGYPHCLRIWNFLADINAGEGDRERYRLFSAGRSRALALKPGFEQRLPAATAIGTYEPGLVIYFLAAKTPGQPVENPRQVSAYRYPRQYGPRSPSFARATLIGEGAATRLLVSGTASVVGHESRHRGDPLRQLEETMANLEAVAAHAVVAHCGGSGSARVRAESLKLYLRDRDLLDELQPLLARLRGPEQAPLLCLRGDICRSDLLVEVEAVLRIDAST
ncbi:MAG: hypothetical protein AB1651_10875 [Pseudomonadota bacterium]